MLFDLLWADPATMEEEKFIESQIFGQNQRGGDTIIFGKKAISKFTQMTGCTHILRAHQSPKVFFFFISFYHPFPSFIFKFFIARYRHWQGCVSTDGVQQQSLLQQHKQRRSCTCSSWCSQHVFHCFLVFFFLFSCFNIKF